MSSIVEMGPDKLQVGCAARQGRGLVSDAHFHRVVWMWFESRTIARRGSGFVNFVRSSTAKRLVRTVLVVPADVADELVVEVGMIRRLQAEDLAAVRGLWQTIRLGK